MGIHVQKTRSLWTWAVMLAIIYLASLYVEVHYFDSHYSNWLFSFVIMAVAVWSGFRIPSLLAALTGLGIGLLVWHYELAMHLHLFATKQSFEIHLIGMAIFMLFSLPVSLLHRRRSRSWHEHIFHRASLRANLGDDGDTGKPCHVRRDSYTSQELQSFAHFAERSRMAVPEWREDTLILYLPGAHTLYRDAPERRHSYSYVRFNSSGEIQAHVSKEDFRRRRDALSFQALCCGVGNIIFDFLQQHREGEQDLVLREIDDDSVQAQIVLFLVAALMYVFSLGLYLNIL
ncbi:MAG: hypothetical protein C0600_00980 [Ignavibacteria bacterium]|nr:MAG: hypothetical protein C0600_00980 [Ignavibacteria bacterium]